MIRGVKVSHNQSVAKRMGCDTGPPPRLRSQWWHYSSEMSAYLPNLPALLEVLPSTPAAYDLRALVEAAADANDAGEIDAALSKVVDGWMRK